MTELGKGVLLAHGVWAVILLVAGGVFWLRQRAREAADEAQLIDAILSFPTVNKAVAEPRTEGTQVSHPRSVGIPKEGSKELERRLDDGADTVTS